MMFIVVASIILGVVLAFKDKRDLGQIIEDIIKKK